MPAPRSCVARLLGGQDEDEARPILRSRGRGRGLEATVIPQKREGEFAAAIKRQTIHVIDPEKDEGASSEEIVTRLGLTLAKRRWAFPLNGFIGPSHPLELERTSGQWRFALNERLSGLGAHFTSFASTPYLLLSTRLNVARPCSSGLDSFDVFRLMVSEVGEST